jgi:hypothetical protein
MPEGKKGSIFLFIKVRWNPSIFKGDVDKTVQFRLFKGGQDDIFFCFQKTEHPDLSGFFILCTAVSAAAANHNVLVVMRYEADYPWCVDIIDFIPDMTY